jgi:hypothetical protein
LHARLHQATAFTHHHHQDPPHPRPRGSQEPSKPARRELQRKGGCGAGPRTSIPVASGPKHAVALARRGKGGGEECMGTKGTAGPAVFGGRRREPRGVAKSGGARGAPPRCSSLRVRPGGETAHAPAPLNLSRIVSSCLPACCRLRALDQEWYGIQ